MARNEHGTERHSRWSAARAARTTIVLLALTLTATMSSAQILDVRELTPPA